VRAISRSSFRRPRRARDGGLSTSGGCDDSRRAFIVRASGGRSVWVIGTLLGAISCSTDTGCGELRPRLRACADRCRSFSSRRKQDKMCLSSAAEKADGSGQSAMLAARGPIFAEMPLWPAEYYGFTNHEPSLARTNYQHDKGLSGRARDRRGGCARPSARSRGACFGDAAKYHLVSVRCGARAPMPGCTGHRPQSRRNERLGEKLART